MFSVDMGGTFTDVVAYVDGEVRTAKVPTDYNQVHRPVLEGAKSLGVAQSDVFNHASTHGLNAVITRQLPKIAFLATEGHRDILDMGRVWRPAEATLNPHWRRSFGDSAKPLVPRYLRRGIRERTMSNGEILFELDEDQARAQLDVLNRCAVEGIAICLLNSYTNSAHEERLRELVREVLGDLPCSISSQVSPLAKEYPRASTTVIDTFMKIIYDDYTARLDAGLRELDFTGQLNFADCAATLVPATQAMEQPFRIMFSGPSAGAVASAHFGDILGQQNLLCADIGGTSCDISVVTNGQPSVETTFELEHDLLVNALTIDVTAIGAGGGSLVSIGAAGELRVGPDSARADPGPACYGRGGTSPTTTDTCLMIGILHSDSFASGQLSLDKELSRRAFERLDTPFTVPQRVRYAYETAITNIAEGLFNVAIKKGVDPRDYSLFAYGAAGPMLLPATLNLVHCKEVIVPPWPGLFSALGLLSADQTYTVNRSAYTLLTAESAPTIDALFTAMEKELDEQLGSEAAVTFRRSFDAHLVGQSWDTPFVPAPDGEITIESVESMIASFHDTYESRSGNRFETVAVEGVTFRIQAVVDTPKVTYPKVSQRGCDPLTAIDRRRLDFLGETANAPGPMALVYSRPSLCAGDIIDGPAIIAEELSTTHVCGDQRATVGIFGELIIRRR